jgi:hypothetical protein
MKPAIIQLGSGILLHMNKVFCILCVLAVLAPAAFARDVIEDQKIAFLINSITEMHDATFIRNGSEYDAQHAGDHMRLKLRVAGNQVRTVEDFIVCCGTGSSISGQPYEIKFADGRVVPSADFLHAKLLEFQAPEPPPVPKAEVPAH